MSQHKSAEVSEAEIAVHWQEEAQIHPSKKFVAQANLVDQRIFVRFSLDNFPDCSGDGLSVAGSTPVIIASIVI